MVHSTCLEQELHNLIPLHVNRISEDIGVLSNVNTSIFQYTSYSVDVATVDSMVQQTVILTWIYSSVLK